MHIEALIAKDFGGYTELEVSDLGAVVGLLGPNGHGKTTILQILEYLFRGEIGGEFKLPMETYLHNFGAADAPVSGSASAIFRHDMQRWCISRQFGKGSTRELRRLDNIPGKKPVTLTADEAVQAELARLFGTDLKTAGDIVFLRQGALMDTLFGTAAEREKMFIKFFGVGNLQKIADRADKKRQEIASGMRDLTKPIDDARAAWEAAERNKQEVDAAYAAIPDFGADMRTLENLRARNDVLMRVSNDLSQAKAADTSAREALSNTFATLVGRTVDELAARVELCVRNEGSARHTLDQEIQLSQLYEQLAQAQQQEREYAATIDRNRPRLTALARVLDGLPSVEAAQQAITDASLKYNQFVEYTKLVAGQQAAVEAQNKLAGRPDGDPDNLDAQAQKLLTQVMPWELAISLARELSAGHATECPVCATKGVHITEDRLRLITGTAETLRRDANTVKARAQALRQAQAEWDRESERASQWRQMWDERLAAAVQPDPKDTAALQAAVTESTALLSTIRTRTAERQQLEADVRQAAALHTQVTATILNTMALIGKRPRPSGQTLSIAWATATTDLARAREELAAGQRAQQQLDRAVAAVTAANNAWIEANRDVTLAQSMLTLQAAAFLRDAGGNVEMAHASLVSRQRARDEARGASEQAAQSAKLARTSLDLLEQQRARQAAKTFICEELSRISQVFSRQGLPMSYVNYRFGQLVLLTAATLTELRAEFTIRQSDAETVSFRFHPNRAPEGVWLHQNKFSGAQKVTLCVAFALAMQRLILPKLGFLILDEPTTHMDNMSVGPVAELLARLGERLKTTHTQLWVSDHHPALVPAFDSIVQVPLKGWQPIDAVEKIGLTPDNPGA